MLILIAKFKETARFENVDDNGQRRINKSYRVHVPYSDGTIIPETIYFPRVPDGRFKEAQLTPDEYYSFPVLARPARDGKRVTYTAVLDMEPFAAPEQVITT